MPVNLIKIMAISPLAAQTGSQINVGRSLRGFRARLHYERRPGMASPRPVGQFQHQWTSRVVPGWNLYRVPTSCAITQAICDYRQAREATGRASTSTKNTHALSGPAQRTALEVLAANEVQTIIQRDDGVTPTPVISRSILVHNRGRKAGLADGIVITPSHNPPEDGGFKYNPTNGGPADTDVARWSSECAPMNWLAAETMRA